MMFWFKNKKRIPEPVNGEIYKCSVQHRETRIMHEAFLKRINGFWVSESGLKVEEYFNVKKWKMI